MTVFTSAAFDSDCAFSRKRGTGILSEPFCRICSVLGCLVAVQ
ncbi:MAG: hypothetical protein NWE79_01470 [Candidatus Bathyarchaeota archaeon]|nr:hypothetical protein [Candidatus Bathyarchaeota archaeon]